MYANGGQGSGVVSFISSDGLSFTPEPGQRLSQPGESGALDCVSSHPWVFAMDGGYRMYYQGDALCAKGGDAHQFRVFSAFSKDGLSFAREGVRIDIGGPTGLTQAAHGRVLRLPDGRYRMFFSANFASKDGPADVLGATSTDGLAWTLDRSPILERAHDPTVISVDGEIRIYTTFLGDNFVVLRSTDGFTFTASKWLDFASIAGARVEEFGDADIIRLADGRLVIYGSGKGSRGVSVMLR
jgi:hypothetical protein